MARSDGLESSHASPFVDFRLRAGSDYHSHCRPGCIFVLLGVPATAALALEHNGAPADSILALARAASAHSILTDSTTPDALCCQCQCWLRPLVRYPS